MGRGKRYGFDYYPKDTNVFSDLKIRRLKSRYGGDGYMVYDYLCCEAFGDKGYYIEYDKDYYFDVADILKLDEERVKEIIDFCIQLDLFDTFQAKKGILTSRGIQRRWIDMCRSAKRSDNEIRQDLLVLENSPLTEVYAEETRVNSEEIHINSEEITQRKERKETKGKKEFIAPSQSEVSKYFVENGFTEQLAERFYKGYSEANWHDTKGNKIRIWKQKAQQVWFKSENKNGKAVLAPGQKLSDPEWNNPNAKDF